MGRTRVSSPGIYFLMKSSAIFGIIAYLEIVDLFSGTRVKTLPELKFRSLSCIKSRIADSEFRDTVYPSTVSVGTVAILPSSKSAII